MKKMNTILDSNQGPSCQMVGRSTTELIMLLFFCVGYKRNVSYKDRKQRTS